MIEYFKHLFNGHKYYTQLIETKNNEKELKKCINEIIYTLFYNKDDFYPFKSINSFDNNDTIYNNLKSIINSNENLFYKVPLFMKIFNSFINNLYKYINYNEKEIKTIKDHINIKDDLQSKELNIDSNLFLTKHYKNKWLLESKSLDLHDSQILFNTLINEDKVYAKGIFDSIQYCKLKKNKRNALYVQLKNNYLTENGMNEIQTHLLLIEKEI